MRLTVITQMYKPNLKNTQFALINAQIYKPNLKNAQFALFNIHTVICK